MGNLNLDLSGSKTLGGGKVVLPTGVYNVEAHSPDVKETNAKTGHYLQVEYKVLDGEHAGKSVIDRFNILNNNPEAVEIGKNQLKTMLTAGQHKNPDMLADTSEVVGLRLRLQVEEVATKWTNNDGEEVDGKENNFKGYFKLEANAPSTSAPQQAQATATAQAPAPTQVQATPAPAPAPASGGAFPWNS